MRANFNKPQDSTLQDSLAALLLVDVVNHFEFPGGERLLSYARGVANNLKTLVQRAHQARIPVIYVNDNFGWWQSNFNDVVDHCVREDIRGHVIARELRPQREDYFVLKPKNSGFYSTNLEVLLNHLGVDTLIITGFTGDNCVLFTSVDAYMRDYQLVIPCDTLASIDPRDNDYMLAFMERALKADITASKDLELARWQP